MIFHNYKMFTPGFMPTSNQKVFTCRQVQTLSPEETWLKFCFHSSECERICICSDIYQAKPSQVGGHIYPLGVLVLCHMLAHRNAAFLFSDERRGANLWVSLQKTPDGSFRDVYRRALSSSGGSKLLSCVFSSRGKTGVLTITFGNPLCPSKHPAY